MLEVAISPVAKGLTLVRAARAPLDSALRGSLYSKAKVEAKDCQGRYHLCPPTGYFDGIRSCTATIHFSPFRLARTKMEIDICPRWILARLGVPERSQHHVALLVSTLFALLAIPIMARIPHICLMRKVLGIACPGCGISHSLTAILRLNPVAAWEANPAGLGVASVFCFQLVARPVAIAAPGTADFVSRMSRHISTVTLGCLLLVWISRVF